MERKKHLFIIVISIMTIPSIGQNNKSIYQAYLDGDMSEWKQIMDSFDAVSQAQKLELLNYQYGYIAYCIGQGKKEEAEKYLNQAEKTISILTKQKYELATLDAYQAAMVGFKIGLAPYKAPFIGSQSTGFAEKALQKDNDNYFAYIQLANIKRYKPAVFGGSKPEAMKDYLKALFLMEEKPESLKYNWNYLNLLASIIELYIEEKQYKTAEEYCQKTLSVAPDFKWVKDELHPLIIKHLNNE